MGSYAIQQIITKYSPYMKANLARSAGLKHGGRLKWKHHVKTRQRMVLWEERVKVKVGKRDQLWAIPAATFSVHRDKQAMRTILIHTKFGSQKTKTKNEWFRGCSMH